MRRFDQHREIALVDLVDRLLDTGVVLTGDITLSVAGVDLVYVGLRALIASVETTEDMRRNAALRQVPRENAAIER
jgi:gas vesicle structural protein